MKIFNSKLCKVVTAFLFAFVISSCEDLNQPVEPGISFGDSEILIPDNIYVGQKNLRTGGISDFVYEKEQLFESLAQSMAKLMDDEKFRSLMKAEANKKFDGDYDILLKDLVKDVDFKNKLNASLSTDRKSNVDQLLQENLRLNVSIPLHNEAWKAEKSQILVAGWKNEKSPFLNAYDSKGKVYVLSQDKSPNVPVMVIGYNERVDERGMLEKDYKKPVATTFKTPDLRRDVLSVTGIAAAPQGVNITHMNSQHLNIYWDDLPDETGYEIWKSYGGTYFQLATLPENSNNYLDYVFLPGVRSYYQIRGVKNSVPQAWSSPITAVAAYRDNGAQLRLKRMRFKDAHSLHQVEKWASGAPEIRLYVTRGNPFNDSVDDKIFGKFEPSNRECEYWVDKMQR